MRILVTGGAGFIGSTIVTAALERGWDVRVLDSLRADVHSSQMHSRQMHSRQVHSRGVHDSELHSREVHDSDPTTGAEFVRGDVRDENLVRDALENVDVVCHQAAKVGLGVDFSDAPDYVGSNELGTAILLKQMAAAGIGRFVQASSMVVYGEGAYAGPNGLTRPAARTREDLDAGRFDPLDEAGNPLTPELIDEDAPLDPRNVYAITKLTQENLATAWARSTGGVAASLRYHNVYGPGMPQNTPYAGVASLFRSAVERGEVPRVFEDGRQRRDFVHSRDVASANLAAIEWTDTQPDEASRAFNVGSGVVHTIADLARQLSAEIAITGEYRLGDVRHITASSERIRRELGWAPAVTFEDGMSEFATAPLRPAVS